MRSGGTGTASYARCGGERSEALVTSAETIGIVGQRLLEGGEFLRSRVEWGGEVPEQWFCDAIDGVIGDVLQHMTQIVLGIEAINLSFMTGFVGDGFLLRSDSPP